MLLGIDLGTSALKVMLFDPEQGTVFQEREPLQILQPAPDLAESDPETWWDALVTVLLRLRRAHPAAMAAVQGIGLSTVFPALVPLDAAGLPLRNALLYCDRRSVPQVATLADSIGLARFERVTGNQLTPGTCVLPGILWLKENEPDVFASAHTFGEASTFLLHRLTGRFAVDMTRSSLSGMVRAGAEDRWDPELLAAVGLEPERLPPLLESTTVVGHVSPGAARAAGLPTGVPVVAGAGDAPMSAAGGGVFGAHELFCSGGTTDCLMFTGARPCANPVFANIRYVLPELWVSIGAMSTGGASVKWFCDSILHQAPQQMTAWAEAAEPGSGGLTFLPYLQGERTPWWDPRARGVFCGLTLTSGREQMCRSVFEGVAFAWKQIIGLLESEHGFSASEIIAVGGPSKNVFWNRVKASALNVPVRALRFTETASLGAAVVAGFGTGLFRSASDAVAATASLHQADTVEPDPDWVVPYTEAYARYTRLYPAVKELFG